MNNDLISVIVPIFNCDKYLQKCVESIQKQTYKNLEIILIDDGSTDNSLNLCKKFAYKDKRIKCVHKENGGVSSARNLGLDIASGRFITFVDSDDWIDSSMIEELYQSITSYHADISNVYFVRNENDREYETDFSNMYKEPCCISQVDAVHELLKTNSFRLRWEVCSKLFKASILDGIRFDSNITMGEDWLFFMSSLTNARKISIVNKCLYHYVLRDNSATQVFSFNRISVCDADEKVLKLNLPMNNKENASVKANIARSAILCKYKWKKQKVYNPYYFNKAQNYIEKYKWYLLKSNEYSITSKIKLLIMNAF